MSEHDLPDGHPIDTTIRAAMDDAGRKADDRSTGDALRAARDARDRHVRHRRRRIRAVTLGAAAVVLLAVIGTVVTVRSGGDQLHTASGGARSQTARVTRVTVDPASGLSDGDTVTVDAEGFNDTTPPPITVYQCAAGNLIDGYVCATSNKATFPVSTDPDAGTAVPAPPGRETSITVHETLTGLVHIRRGEGTTAVITTPVDQSDIKCATQPSAATTDAASSAPDAAGGVTTEPCVILVVGNWPGGTLMATAPIWFGPAGTPTDTAPPTTQRPDVPGSAMCPGSVAQEPDISGVDRTSALLDFTPTKAVICTYFLGPEDPSGPPRAVRTIDDTATLAKIRSDLNALGEVPDQVFCTADGGPTMAIIATAGSRTATIWAQDYGCGFTFNGNRMRMGAKSLSWLRG